MNHPPSFSPLLVTISTLLTSLLHSLSPDMRIFESYILWPTFERLHGLEASTPEMVLSAKAIANRSNVVITCTGILCGFITSSFLPPVCVSLTASS
ncbi:hypothetical protein DL96DRAFT_1640655 [Flagelloscypha sp. PMI_526]|nr:hypothetical protein DL96DRAFT_1640655 [Flagelloscypha sp. PMI_526]